MLTPDHPALPLTQAASWLGSMRRREHCLRVTAMLGMPLKSSLKISALQKMRVDFVPHMSVGRGMKNLDEIDPGKARSGLFALVTARLEDAHELAVRGQRPEIERGDVTELIEELVDQISQIEIMIMAIGSMRE